jgi:hypothetical protein
MVDASGSVFGGDDDEGNWLEAASIYLDAEGPALDSPANWGHWLAWTADTLGPGSVELRRSGPRSGPWWSAESVQAYTGEHETPAAALLELYCHCTAEGELPQEVREWWQHEKEGY